MDEQLTRAQFAERKGLGLCLRVHEVYKMGPYIARMLDPRFRAKIAASCAELSYGNGAGEVVEFLDQLVYTVCADREPRGYWAAP
jgi:UDP-N-acetylglucosamine:LPS N-acetylglucosamine transferase